MSKVYMSELEDEGQKKYGLFYEDKRGIKQHLTEDFKEIVFDTEAEAKKKLEAIEVERLSEDSAEAFSVEEAV